jgi:hypothetical protein
MRALKTIAIALVVLFLAGCSGGQKDKPVSKLPPSKPPPAGPKRIVLVDKPVQLQDQTEPFFTEANFEFELPRRPYRAKLKMRYSGVPGALSEDYKMGRYRHRVRLNDRHLMDLNTHSDGEDHVVEYYNWISVGRFKRHNKLTFIAGDDQSPEGRPNCDEFDLRHVSIEFQW